MTRQALAALWRSAQLARERTPFYASVARAVTLALWQRVRRGRRHEHWTLRYELAMTALRVATQQHAELMGALVREQVAPIPRSLAGKVQIGTSRLASVEVEVHTPSLRRPGAGALLYFHGGGYTTCSPRSHRDVIARIAHAAQLPCFAPAYRLAPEHPFPAALDDARACYEALLRAGRAPGDLFVGGDSAGGGLAAALLVQLRDQGRPLPRAGILLSPWVDLSLSARQLRAQAPHDYPAARRLPRNAAQYAARAALDHPLISPVYADLRGLPPLLVQTGEWELLCEQNLRFVRAARAAGVPVEHTVAPGMLHAFTCFAGLTPQGAQAIAAIGGFVSGFVEQPRASGAVRWSDTRN